MCTGVYKGAVLFTGAITRSLLVSLSQNLRGRSRIVLQPKGQKTPAVERYRFLPLGKNGTVIPTTLFAFLCQ